MLDIGWTVSATLAKDGAHGLLADGIIRLPCIAINPYCTSPIDVLLAAILMNYRVVVASHRIAVLCSLVVVRVISRAAIRVPVGKVRTLSSNIDVARLTTNPMELARILREMVYRPRYVVLWGFFHVQLLSHCAVKDAVGIYRMELRRKSGLRAHGERMHVELEAFPAIADILNRIQKDNGRLGAQQDWFKEICPPHPCVCIILSRWTCLMNISQCTLSV